MSAATDSLVTVAAVTSAAGIAAVRDIQEGTPSMKPVIGGAVLGAFLLFIAIFNAQVAKAIAILVLATSALVNGAVVFKVAERIVA